MCRVFPSSLGPMSIRWFDGLRINSINSFKKFTQSFCSRFITCSRVPQPLDSLLSMSMREGESVKVYAKRYWEMFNEIDGDFDEVAIRTFKVGLPSEYGLRKSLTGKPVTSLCQLMDRVDKYKRIEDDQQQGKGKAKVIPQERRDLGQTNTATTGQEGIMQINQGQTTLKLSVQSSESLCIKYWKKSRMNPSSNDPIRWWEIPKSETVTSIANTIRIMGIPQRIVGVCWIIWTNLFERVN